MVPPPLEFFFIAHDVVSELLIIGAAIALVLALRAKQQLEQERARVQQESVAVAAYRQQLQHYEQHIAQRERYLTRQLPLTSNSIHRKRAALGASVPAGLSTHGGHPATAVAGPDAPTERMATSYR